MALAQATVDGEIDSRARRLHGVSLPFSPVPDSIRGMAARETVRVLRAWKRAPTDRDADDRRIFEAWLEQLAAGLVIPPAADTYPIGDGGGAPVSGTRVLSDDEVDEGSNDRCSLRGLW
jgi:hypothetical protein